MIIRMLEGYEFLCNLYSMVAIQSVKFRENREILFSLRIPEEKERKSCKIVARFYIVVFCAGGGDKRLAKNKIVSCNAHT